MRVAVGALVGAFVVALVCVAVTPLREFTQEVAVCRGADRVERDVRASGSEDGFALACTYDEGARIEGISSGKAILGGVGVSVLAGILLGALSALATRPFRRRTS